MGQAQQTKAASNRYRREKILEMVSKPGGASSKRMAEKFHTTRAAIIQDIRDLRKQGHPIQASSMVTEGGMYVAVFEMLGKGLAKS